MGARDIERDGEAKPGARLIEITGIVEPHKGPEGIGALPGRYARTIVIDNKYKMMRRRFSRYLDLATKTSRVADEIVQEAAEGIGLQPGSKAISQPDTHLLRTSGDNARAGADRFGQ